MSIVVGYDNTAAARCALETALALAAGLGEDVVAVYGAAPSRAVGEEYRAMEEAIAELGENALEHAHAIAAGHGVEIEIVLVDDSPQDALAGIADARDARMIVVGAVAPGTLREAVLGSIARRVLASTTRPVLVVQAPHTAR
ncbi:MAG: universal stress protein [Gammaproteobacteria bacterium]